MSGRVFACGVAAVGIMLTGCGSSGDDIPQSSPYLVTQRIDGTPQRAWGFQARQAIGCGDRLVVWTGEAVEGRSIDDGTLLWSTDITFEAPFLYCPPSAEWVALSGGDANLLLKMSDGAELASDIAGTIRIAADDFIVVTTDKTIYNYQPGESIQNWLFPADAITSGVEFGDWLAFTSSEGESLVIHRELGDLAPWSPTGCATFVSTSHLLLCNSYDSQGMPRTDAYSLSGKLLWQRPGEAVQGAFEEVWILEGSKVDNVNLQTGEALSSIAVPLDAPYAIPLPGFGLVMMNWDIPINQANTPGYFFDNEGKQVLTAPAFGRNITSHGRQLFLYSEDALIISDLEASTCSRFSLEDKVVDWSIALTDGEMCSVLGGQLFLVQEVPEYNPTSIRGYVALKADNE